MSFFFYDCVFLLLWLNSIWHRSTVGDGIMLITVILWANMYLCMSQPVVVWRCVLTHRVLFCPQWEVKGGASQIFWRRRQWGTLLHIQHHPDCSASHKKRKEHRGGAFSRVKGQTVLVTRFSSDMWDNFNDATEGTCPITPVKTQSFSLKC